MGLDEPSPTTGQKPERPVKKRASQACHHCRTRKVKCDLVKSGTPCHNCSVDGIECVITESRRSRKYRLQKRLLNRTTSIPLLPQTQPGPPGPPGPSAPTPQSSHHAFSPPATLPVPSPASRSQSGHDQGSPSLHINPSNQFQSPPAFTPVLNLTGPASSRRGTTGTPASVQASFSIPTLPSYIRPASRELSADDLELLYRRGALSIPDDELRDQLLRAFILYVYPFLPVVDLQEFLQAVDGNGGTRISLLLFQAVMFAGTAFVDLQFLIMAGFADRRAARLHFHNKAKLLSDFDWEADRPTTIQAILLQAYWYVAENDLKDPWYWLGAAISLATTCGLNQRSTILKKDPRTAKLWRRIFWSCYIRDRVMAISMRKPMRMKDESHLLPMLTMDDFELEPIQTSIAAVRDCAFFASRSTRVALAEMCISNIKILSIIGRIIRKLYLLQGFAGTTADSIMLYSPKKSNIEAKDVLELQNELDRWQRTLTPSCRITNYNVGQQPSEIFLHLHRSVLSMMFWMALEALHRPTTLAKDPSSSLSNALQQIPRPRVKEAAERMSELVQSLREQDLVRFLPPISVAFMLPAIASFLVEIKSTGKSLGDLPGHQFHQCVRALLSLRDIWPIADSACFLVGLMITNSQIGTARTLGMQAVPVAVANDSLDTSRESSVLNPQAEENENTNTRNEGEAYQSRALDEVDQEEGNDDEDLTSHPEIPGVIMPATIDLGYSPVNMGAFPGAWGEQFQFPWTMAEFGFNDGGSFLLDENDMYNMDPIMADYSGIGGGMAVDDGAFDHALMDFDHTTTAANMQSSNPLSHEGASSTYPAVNPAGGVNNATTTDSGEWNPAKTQQAYHQHRRSGLPT